MPNPGSRPTCAPSSRSSSAQNEWIVPRLTSSTRVPSCSRREAISSAALLVNVKTQIRSGSTRRSSTRNRTRSMRQNVLPAPGPARTRTGPRGASIASRCEGVGVRGESDAIVAPIAAIASDPARLETGAVRCERGYRRTARAQSCHPSPSREPSPPCPGADQSA